MEWNFFFLSAKIWKLKLSHLSAHGNMTIATTFFSYLTIDWLTTRDIINFQMLIHHLLLIIGIPIQFWKRAAVNLSPILLVMETSTIFLNLLWIVDATKLDRKYPRLRLLLVSIFVISFFYLRLIKFNQVIVALFRDKELHYDRKRLGPFMYLLQVLSLLQFKLMIW